MKSLKKKTLAKNLRLRKVTKAQDDNNIVLDLGNSYDAAYPYDSIAYSGGVDTITLDPTVYSAIQSLTLPTTVSVTGTGGLYNTTVPSGGYTLTSSPNTNVTWSTGTSNAYQTNTTVNIDKDGVSIKEGADLVVGGKSLTKFIERVEEHLAILHPNPELEERWNQLKELRKQYIEMEKDLLEKDKLMKILKEA